MLYKQQNQQYPEPQQELSTYGNLYPYYANKEYINSPIYRNFLNSIQAPKTKAGYEHKLLILFINTYKMTTLRNQILNMHQYLIYYGGPGNLT